MSRTQLAAVYFIIALKVTGIVREQQDCGTAEKLKIKMMTSFPILITA